MRHKFKLIRVLIGLVLALVLLSHFHGSRAEANGQQQTVPTRTPTPVPSTPEPSPEPTEPSDSVPPTATPSTAATATSTPTSSSTAETGAPPPTETTATDDSILNCESPAVAIALQDVDVRERPREDASIIGLLSFQDARPLLGRTFDAQWWLLEYSSEQIGWVNQQQVQLQGCVDLLEVVSEDSVAEHQAAVAEPSQRPDPPPEGAQQGSAAPEVTLNDERVGVEIPGTPMNETGQSNPTQSEPSPIDSTATADDLTDGGLPLLTWMLAIGVLLLVIGAFLLIVNRLRRE